MSRFFACLSLFLMLAACGTATRYIVDAPTPANVVRVPVATLEVKDLVLPDHASGAEVLLEEPDGGLKEVGGATWADDPVRSLTATLARALDTGSTATVASEPWPLFDPAQAELVVRIDRMLAHSNGTFELQAQIAVTSRDNIVRDRIQRVSIVTPLPSPDAAGIAQASGTAIQLLADRILLMLAN